MKKILLAAIIGGLIIFIWQFLSFALINLHQPAQNYTPKQDAIMSALSAQQLEEGGYIVPSLPPDATMDDHEKFVAEAGGKPWAMIQYHHDMEMNMTLNMVRGFLINIIMVAMLAWLLVRLMADSFSIILTACLITGLIVFFNAHYTNFIWYQTFDIWAHFIDAIVSWGLTGLFLGWWLLRDKAHLSNAHVRQTSTTVVD